MVIVLGGSGRGPVAVSSPEKQSCWRGPGFKRGHYTALLPDVAANNILGFRNYTHMESELLYEVVGTL